MAGGGEVKLLGFCESPYVVRVQIALNIKSVSHQFLEENLPEKSQLLIQSNPVHKKVPVLIHGGNPICESLIIVQYIDEVWPSGPAILPSDPYDRATCRFWAAYIDDKWFASLRAIPAAENEEARDAAVEKVAEGLALLEGEFRRRCGGDNNGKAFFGGDSIGYLDIALGCFLGWIKIIEKLDGVVFVDGSRTPGLAGWAERFCSDPAVRDVMPETDKLVEFAKVLFPRKEKIPGDQGRCLNVMWPRANPNEGGQVKLLGVWPSPFVMRARIALNIKSVSHEFVQENLREKSQLLIQSNPVHKKVPVLIHDGKAICESLVIVQYIDEVWSSSGPAILPSEPYDRATARFWVTYIETKLNDSMRGIGTAEGEEARKAAAVQVKEVLAVLEDAFAKCSKGKGFFGGDSIGYLDIALGCFLGWIRVSEKLNGVVLVDGSTTPGLAGWAERFCSDPAVRDVMPETEKLAEFAKMIFPRYKNAPPKPQ
ncbi:hypothetical protein SAY86_031525 [Trapa natans]|uniref:glutathione transferase n=1 Tax=Trapa natans TaxID=22666 RepID=A0AAN7LS37_TRANT|nr:hypothetical protein SAY86_031525 [Trapa natans]